MFLYQEWLVEELHRYVGSASQPLVKGRPVVLSPRQYGAALLQAYLGKARLTWMAEIAGVTLQTLTAWRREPEFLLVMDGSKSRFAEFFRETLLLTDFSAAQANDLAAEFAALEDSLRIRVRSRLYQTFRNLGERLLSPGESGISLEGPDLTRFRRLFLFFWILEHYYWPSPARRRLEEEFEPLAREVVWPRLGWAYEVEPGLIYSWPQLFHLLGGRLKQAFDGLPPYS